MEYGFRKEAQFDLVGETEGRNYLKIGDDLMVSM